MARRKLRWIYESIGTENETGLATTREEGSPPTDEILRPNSRWQHENRRESDSQSDPLFLNQVATQLSSRGWVDPCSRPNPHFKFVKIPGIEPATSWSGVRNAYPWTNEAVRDRWIVLINVLVTKEMIWKNTGGVVHGRTVLRWILKKQVSMWWIERNYLRIENIGEY